MRKRKLFFAILSLMFLTACSNTKGNSKKETNENSYLSLNTTFCKDIKTIDKSTTHISKSIKYNFENIEALRNSIYTNKQNGYSLPITQLLLTIDDCDSCIKYEEITTKEAYNQNEQLKKSLGNKNLLLNYIELNKNEKVRKKEIKTLLDTLETVNKSDLKGYTPMLLSFVKINKNNPNKPVWMLAYKQSIVEGHLSPELDEDNLLEAIIDLQQ